MRHTPPPETIGWQCSSCVCGEPLSATVAVATWTCCGCYCIGCWASCIEALVCVQKGAKLMKKTAGKAVLVPAAVRNMYAPLQDCSECKQGKPATASRLPQAPALDQSVETTGESNHNMKVVLKKSHSASCCPGSYHCMLGVQVLQLHVCPGTVKSLALLMQCAHMFCACKLIVP